MPLRYPGACRRVYPGFVQLAAFMSMNIERHIKAHRELYEHLANGEHEKAETIKAFYDEYFAVLDLTAEFYLETVQRVFQEHRAADAASSNGSGQQVDPRAIRRTALLTVEGERDDICAIGQTAGGARPVHQAAALSASATTCRPASATTACSAASAGPTDLSVAEKRHSGKRVSFERISLSGAHAWDRRHQPISQYAVLGLCAILPQSAVWRESVSARSEKTAAGSPAGNRRCDRPLCSTALGAACDRLTPTD